MDTQYKFRWILRDNDGVIVKALIVFHEGAYNPVKKTFRIIRKLGRSDLWHLKSTMFNPWNNEEVLYLPKDFGRISTDDELRNFLNDEIAKDVGRKPIPEQNIRSHG